MLVTEEKSIEEKITHYWLNKKNSYAFGGGGVVSVKNWNMVFGEMKMCFFLEWLVL